MGDIKFITKDGLKSAKKAAEHKIDGFLEKVYFKEEVLKRYESHKDFTIGDNGTVLFGNKWGIFRGVYRVAKGFIAVNLGDLGEGLPDKELEYWKKYNISPSKIPAGESYFDFRDTIRRMVHFMNLSNTRVENHIKKFYPNIKVEDMRLLDLTRMENALNHIKKVINKETTVDDFQARIIFLNILLLESINTKLINKIFNKIDKNLCYSYEKLALKEIEEKYLKGDTPKKLKDILNNSIEPLKSLRLLQKFLLLLKVHHDIIISLNIKNLKDLRKKEKNIYSKISNEFTNFYNYKIYGTNFKNKDYFLQNEGIIEDGTKFLKLLNKFRSSSAAHGFNEKEYKKILDQLGFKETIEDYSIIFETLITRTSYDIERIYFSLLTPEPPIIDYYKEYLKHSLKELNEDSKESKYVFEELASYLYDFPEMYDDLLKGVLKTYSKKKRDRKFILEFGCFTENISYSMGEKTQELIDYLIEGYENNKPLVLAHLSHIIKNSKTISNKFYKKVYELLLKSLNDKDADVDFCSQHVILCLIEKFPKKMNKKEVSEALKNKKIHFHQIKKYMQSK
ncbi:MAG: hypothetical protein WC494_03145 [Candidatus Pacearchaeota archaeon]